MMKILSTAQMRKADAYTIASEPIRSIDLMERASAAFVQWFADQFSTGQEVWVFCGTGNNGGDGLAAARMLSASRYKVSVYIIHPQSKHSPDFDTNHKRLPKSIDCLEISEVHDIPPIQDGAILIDAMFGSGLSRPVQGIYADVANAINESTNRAVAIDIPSGLLADELTSANTIVKADDTVTFQLPKLSFFMQEAHMYVGEWHMVDIGLDQHFIEQSETEDYLLTCETIKSYIRPRSKYSHKGTYGRALLIAGSCGKMGAAVLSGRAALRSGVGLLTIHSPTCGVEVLQMSVPEAMVSVDPTAFYFGEVPDTSDYTAIGIGPGLDQKSKTVKALGELLGQLSKPVVIDADAINSVAHHRHLLPLIPEGSIMTPHHREFERLVGKWGHDFERLALQKEFSKKHQVIIVFKGPYTTITTPSGEAFFNITGNPGMATAGSGDVLTGLITGFLAQGCTPLEAAQLGVYSHGLAGDLAAQQKGEMSLIASDIIDAVAEALMSL